MEYLDFSKSEAIFCIDRQSSRTSSLSNNRSVLICIFLSPTTKTLFFMLMFYQLFGAPRFLSIKIVSQKRRKTTFSYHIRPQKTPLILRGVCVEIGLKLRLISTTAPPPKIKGGGQAPLDCIETIQTPDLLCYICKTLCKQLCRFSHAACHGNTEGTSGFTAFAADTVFRIGGKLVIMSPQCSRNLILHYS